MNKNISSILAFTMIAVAIFLSIGFVSAFASPANVDLGTASNYIILAKTAVTTTGVTAITGDIGISPSLSSDTSGFGLILDGSGAYSTSSLVNGKIYAADYSTPTPTILTTAVADMENAYTNALGRAADQTNPGSAGEIGGLTIFPGVYTFNGGSVNVHISTDLTLSGGTNDVWIFQIPGTFDIANSKQVILTGGAQAKNIFWVVAGATTLSPNSNLQGNILDSTSIAIQNDATLNGRALAQTAVTLIANTVVLSTVTPQFSNYTISLSSSQNVSITANRGNISIDGISSILPTARLLTNTTHSIAFTPSVGFAFLRWNATGGLVVSNNLTNVTTVTVNGNGVLNAIYYNTSLPPILSTIVLSQASANLVIGQNLQLTAATLDQFGDSISTVVNYTSSNISVATVGSTGLVTASVIGNTTILASNGTLNDTIYINVIAATVAPATSSTSGGNGGGGRSCSTKWTCTDWSACADSAQTRTCSYPTNWCMPVANKPIVSQACTIQSTSEAETPETTPTTNSGITGNVIGSAGKIWIAGIIILVALIAAGYFVMAARKNISK